MNYRESSWFLDLRCGELALVGTIGDAMTTDVPTRKLNLGKAIARGVEIGMIAAIVLLQFRLLTLCIILLFGTVMSSIARFRRRDIYIMFGILVAISMFLPFDIAIGPYHYGSRRDTSPGGPHLVEFVVGLPRHTHLIERYGEYISGGCSWPAILPPRWILVWN